LEPKPHCRNYRKMLEKLIREEMLVNGESFVAWNIVFSGF